MPVDDNLAQKLAACLDEFSQSTGISAHLVVADSDIVVLPALAQLQVVQIVREVLTNVRRHAQAGQVWVRVEQTDGLTSLTIEDDGCGFDPSAVQSDNHLGLTIIGLRAERSGGKVMVDSRPGAGTRIVICYPASIVQLEAEQRGMSL